MLSVIMDAIFVEHYSEKLSSKSELAQNNTCRLWTGSVKPGKQPPYGIIHIKIDDKWTTIAVHRLAYALNHNLKLSDMERTLDVSHLCHNSLCTNADHLSYEPHYINNNRITCKGRGHCLGHDNYPLCMIRLIL